MQINVKISHLWFVIIFGSIVHTMLSMMPLFFGQSIGSEGASEGDIAGALLFVLTMFLIPLMLVVLIQIIEAAWLCYANLTFAILFLFLNVMHPMELFEAETFDWVQFILMVFIALSNLVLCHQAWQWVKENKA